VSFYDCWKSLADTIIEEMTIETREQELAFSQGKNFENSGRASKGLQSGALVKRKEPRYDSDAICVRQ
jgi:hypothetical protein